MADLPKLGKLQQTVDDTFGESGEIAKLAKTDQSAAEQAPEITCGLVANGGHSQRKPVGQPTAFSCGLVANWGHSQQ
jgi:hypothetical protein